MLFGMKGVVGIGLLVALACTAGAYDLEQVDVEAWVGSGANTVLWVVDFWPGDGNHNSFAFGYRFDAPSITGMELLDALQAANIGLSYAEGEWEGYITDIWYVRAGITYHTADNWPAWYWGYWVSGDLGESWEYSWVGAGDRVLFDGDTDGWLALPGDDYTSVPVTPLVPVAFVGDVNGDGKVTFADIDPFVLALSGESAYDRVFSHGRYLNADCNGDGKITFADIDPFVARLGQSSTK